MLVKSCAKCGQEKPIERFESRRRSDGSTYRRSACNDCRNAAARARWEARKIDSTLRPCPRCKREFPTKEFWRAYCPDCKRAIQREKGYWNAEHRKAWARNHYLKVTYGITQEQYEEMLAAQGGGCAICGATRADATSRRLFIDHDHLTGQVRAILCARCNFAVKGLADDALWGRSVIAYIERHHVLAA